MPKFKETIDYTGEVVRTSDLAILMRLDEVDGEIWFPLSQVDEDSEIDEETSPGDEGTITVSEWIAIQKGLV